MVTDMIALVKMTSMKLVTWMDMDSVMDLVIGESDHRILLANNIHASSYHSLNKSRYVV
ncbi:hypothetical protein A2U01_0081423, partial [Trifolium medium]|nr:hypothetical protein [Trifolium medium]